MRIKLFRKRQNNFSVHQKCTKLALQKSAKLKLEWKGLACRKRKTARAKRASKRAQAKAHWLMTWPAAAKVARKGPGKAQTHFTLYYYCHFNRKTNRKKERESKSQSFSQLVWPQKAAAAAAGEWKAKKVVIQTSTWGKREWGIFIAALHSQVNDRKAVLRASIRVGSTLCLSVL